MKPINDTINMNQNPTVSRKNIDGNGELFLHQWFSII